MTVGPPRKLVFILKILNDPNESFNSSQESAASGFSRPLFSAVDPYSGLGPGAQMALERAGLSGAANSLSLEEIAALQEDYSSDDAA